MRGFTETISSKGRYVQPAHVQALQDRFVLGMLVGDAALCASVYAADACIVPPNGALIRGRHRIADYWQRVIDEGGRGDAVVTEEVQNWGSVLIERGVYARFPHPVALGKPIERGSYTVVIEQAGDGAWYWTTDLWTPTKL
jgi:ketosteroid isomerase-like protein